MHKIDVGKIWSLNYRLLMSVITGVAPDITELGLETKELFVLAEVDAHPHPAELAGVLCMPKPSVTVYIKRLEAAGLLRREIDGCALRRRRESAWRDPSNDDSANGDLIQSINQFIEHRIPALCHVLGHRVIVRVL